METWLVESIDNGFELPSYLSYTVYRSSHGGGIKLYISTSFRSAKIKELCQVNNLFESLFAEISIGHSNKINLGCIYRIPSSSIIDFNNDFFNNYISQFSRQDTIIMGDMNINLYNPHRILAIDEYLQNFLSLNFKPLVQYPTRVHKDENGVVNYSLIDHIFSNIDQKSYSSVIQYELTDHLPIVSFIPLNDSQVSEEKTFYTRSFSDHKINIFSEHLEQLVSNFYVSEHEPDESFSLFVEQFYKVYYECFPLKAVTKEKCAPWITNDIKECIKKKSTLYSLFRRGAIPKSHYRNYCYLLTSIIRLIKNNYYN